MTTSKKKPEKLTPATSEARYPTLVELRRDKGLMKSGLAAAVLASGLAGCGSKDAVPLSGKVDGSYFAQDVQRPDLGGGSIDVAAPDAGQLLDVIRDLPLDSQGNDATDLPRPDTGAPDRIIIIDGLPPINYPIRVDGGIDSAGDARDGAQESTGDARQDSGPLDGQPGEVGAGPSTDAEIDLK